MALRHAQGGKLAESETATVGGAMMVDGWNHGLNHTWHVEAA